MKAAEAAETDERRRLEKEEHDRNIEVSKAKDALIASQKAEAISSSEADIADAQKA